MVTFLLGFIVGGVVIGLAIFAYIVWQMKDMFG